MGVRGAKQILPQDGALALHGTALTPSPRDVMAGSRSRAQAPPCEPPWPHVENGPKAPHRAEGVIKQVVRKESDFHNILVSRMCSRNARYEHHLTYPSTSGISLAFFVKNFRQAEM